LKAEVFINKENILESRFARRIYLYMRRADRITFTFVTAALVLVILLFTFLTVLFIQDTLNRGKIFPGITIGGHPVGGMTREQAVQAVSKNIGEPLKRPLTVYYGEKEEVLNPEKIELNINPNAMVEYAYWTGQSRFFIERMFRRFFKKPLKIDIPTLVSFNEKKLEDVVIKFAKEFNYPPTNASIDVSSGSPIIKESREGLEVQVKKSVQKIAKALAKPERRVSLVVKILKPSIYTGDIGKIIIIKLHEFTLYLYDRENLISSYIVGIGMPEYPTPTGKFHITYKEKNPTWLPTSEWAKDKRGIPVPPGPDNPLGGYWMDLGGGIGIHATPYEKTLGMAASHGCIRMAPWAAEELFYKVKVGTPVFILP